MRRLAALLLLGTALVAQRWQDTCGKTPSGQVQLLQAAKDAGSDALVLLVAAHPDDRYVLPATWIRSCLGARVAVLLATRGGGGQNSLGPESGDAFERIRTLEAEAGCSNFGADVYYLDRPDCGYRRTAEEAFAEWGRDGTLRDLVRLIRTIRPDVVATTHHAEEAHGHDRALAELLPEAVALAHDPAFSTTGPPHRVRAFLLGGGGVSLPTELRVPADRLEPLRGRTLRRLAYDVLAKAHVSPGALAPLETIFEAELRFAPQILPGPTSAASPFGPLPSLFDDDLWPGDRAEVQNLRELLERDLPALAARGAAAIEPATRALQRLRELARDRPPGDVAARLARRIEALERLLLQLHGVSIETEVPPGAAAIAGEEFPVAVHLHAPDDLATTLRAEGLDGIEVGLETLDGRDLEQPGRGPVNALATVRTPLRAARSGDPMAARFRADRFVPPVRIRFRVGAGDLELPATVTVPVEERAPVELSVVPRMLLLPSSRQTLQFSIGVLRNTRFPVVGDLEVRTPAGYAIQQDRRAVALRDQRGDLFGFEVRATDDRRAGVDVLRIALNDQRVVLPVHKIDVKIPAALRIGVLRSRDDTLPGVLGVGGFGLAWSELSDTDVAAGDLLAFDTIVVDVRALRDRPAVRTGFRRLLEFAAQKGHRLVVFYHKDSEFHPAGEGFLGAPFAPFQVGRARVTRADAPVRMLVPDHALLRFPNVIQPSDWDGWEQERALYLPGVYASQYLELLEMQDPGQPAERGALLYASTGEGEFVYCALALWRQLKKLHPGAVRLLANLLTPRAG